MKSKLLVPIFGPALGCLPDPSVNEVLKQSSELASVRPVKAAWGSTEERCRGTRRILHKTLEGSLQSR